MPVLRAVGQHGVSMGSAWVSMGQHGLYCLGCVQWLIAMCTLVATASSTFGQQTRKKKEGIVAFDATGLCIGMASVCGSHKRKHWH